MSNIPVYTEINDFLASIPWPAKTADPDFYCLRLKKLDQGPPVYRPPFRRTFYFLALLINTGKVEVSHGEQTVRDPDSYLVFHSPNLVYSFSHDNSLEGYVIYFRSACFSFFRPDFHKTFPLFDPLHTNLFQFDHPTFERLAPHFEAVFTAYEGSAKEQHVEARTKLLGLLYHLEDFAAEKKKATDPPTTQQSLLRKYIQLVNSHYIDKRTVQEYADLLSITSNYLSQSVKQASGKNAHAYIVERLVTEAKSLIRYTTLEITQIAYQLDFSDPANFGKFFKKHTGVSPLEFRKSQVSKFTGLSKL